ncbi:MAG: helix-turn-helix transcriptional regulator [Deltaproteobacteria bacterium]|jgi:DNA-binding PadR family transcriptional regulator|nr:helix-turn-helix transcriptional regulator [Deltaproteobacteria bacterium]MBW2543297.1 helix-turn-helix transcriptional regulator [Deltaproteobacteria bacterium]
MSTNSQANPTQNSRRSRANEAPPRLSGKEAVVLELLQDGEQYGLEIVRLSDGRLKRGTVYTTLNRMQQKGYVESRSEEKPAHVPGIPRRLFRATPYGLRLLAAHELATNFLLQEVPA